MNRRQLIASALGLALSVACYSAASATPLLGSTGETFAVLGAAGVTSSGTTTINGNVGSAPTNTISGFPPGVITNGTMTSTATAQQAQGDALAAYNFLAGQTPTQTLAASIGPLILTPGIYNFSSSAVSLTGTLTLDAQGSNNAVFIFEIGSTLTTASSASVDLINGGPDDGVFWQVGSSATLGDSTSFEGNILANTSISLDPSAAITCGRALAGIVTTSGAVTMADTNHVAIDNGSSCAGGYGGGYESVAGGGFERISSTTSVPEPATLTLFAAGLAGLAMLRRRRKA